MSWAKIGLFLGLGLVGLPLGADLLVDSAVNIATSFGVSETVIGLTLVAFGTSLPELVASVMAALRRESALAFGNVVGSNIYNILGILGVTALVQPLSVPLQIAQLDIWVMCAATLALVLAVVWNRGIGRAMGAAFLASYAAYTVWLVTAS